MLAPLTGLLSCQLLGEVLVRVTGIPLPGPVAGMAMLFAILAVRGSVPESLEELANGLLANLSVLFVPAGVGVMLYLPLVASEWLPIAVALVVSTLGTIAVTAGVMRALAPAAEGPERREPPSP